MHTYILVMYTYILVHVYIHTCSCIHTYLLHTRVGCIVFCTHVQIGCIYLLAASYFIHSYVSPAYTYWLNIRIGCIVLCTDVSIGCIYVMAELYSARTCAAAANMFIVLLNYQLVVNGITYDGKLPTWHGCSYVLSLTCQLGMDAVTY